MARRPAVSDEFLAQALGSYAGMVDHVVTDPERWLGADDPTESSGGVPRRVVEAVRDRVRGDHAPGSAGWDQLPLDTRVDWWVDRIGLSAGLAAAGPRFAGALSDRVPLQAALGASAAGLAVCAVAREHGVVDPKDWVPLLAKVLVDRELPARAAAVPPPTQSESALTTDTDADPDVDASRIATMSQGAQRAAKTLWRLARTFFELQHLLDERPRGGLLARTVAKVPVVGVAGGWLDERGGIRKAAQETRALLTAPPRGDG